MQATKPKLLPTASEHDDPAYDTIGAGIYLGGPDNPVSDKTLANWRSAGTGPEYELLSGRLIRYRKSKLDEFRANRRRRSTSEPFTTIGEAAERVVERVRRRRRSAGESAST